MKKKTKKLYLQTKKRKLKRIIGTSEKPRLAVFRSHKHIYAQLIDDNTGRTIAASSTLNKSVKPQLESTADTKAARIVGEAIGKLSLEKNVTNVVFDRGNRPYHGRIKNVAEGARATGLIF
jgi:large subunit ribosomal protein L18